jgi:hypothetical protein
MLSLSFLARFPRGLAPISSPRGRNSPVIDASRPPPLVPARPRSDSLLPAERPLLAHRAGRLPKMAELPCVCLLSGSTPLRRNRPCSTGARAGTHAASRGPHAVRIASISRSVPVGTSRAGPCARCTRHRQRWPRPASRSCSLRREMSSRRPGWEAPCSARRWADR